MKADRKQFIRQFYRANKLNFAVIFILNLAEVAVSLLIAYLLQQILDIASEGTTDDLKIALFYTIGVAAAFLTVALLRMYFLPHYKAKAARQYKNFIYNQLLQKSIVSFSKDGAAGYISALTNDLNTIEQNYIENIFDMIENILLFVGAIALMLYNSPLLTSIGVGVSLIPLVLSVVMGGMIGKREKAVSDKNGEFVHFVSDSLNGFNVIKNFKVESKIANLFRKNNAVVERAKETKNRSVILIRSLCGFFGVIAQFAVFAVGAYICITSPDKLSVGTIIMFVQLMNYVVNPLTSVPQAIALRRACIPLIDKVAEMLSEKDVGENRNFSATLDNSITLSDVSFGYTDDKKVINGLSYTFEKDKAYAIVGASGSGKTTLFNLLLGMYDNYEGSIRFDDNEMKNITTDSLYDRIALVSQNVFVFDDTIANNITMYGEADKAEIDRVVEQVALKDLIDEKGADYCCGLNGKNLSGGQIQRISIARGLLKRAPLLMMDEATSALDVETAAHINAEILNVPNTTKIVITHRLDEQTLKLFDSILFMKNGEIAETGTFDELMKSDGLFASMYKLSQ